MHRGQLTSISNTGGDLTSYLYKVRGFPMLSFEEEQSLANAWVNEYNEAAAEKLIASHLRLVVRIASGYKGYGLPISELISEGNIGLVKAVKRFDPDKGFRLATYAIWWIRASIQEYILRSWSMVKIGTTAAQKKLFFNLRKIKNELNIPPNTELTQKSIKTIAEALDVDESEVVSMNGRLSGQDQSLNAEVSHDGTGSWQDWVIDEDENQEAELAQKEEATIRKQLVSKALAQLNEREREIFIARRILDPVVTLNDLSTQYGVSRERIRQIEMRAFEKVQQLVQAEVLKKHITLN